MSQRYQFTPRDAELLWAATLLLRKVMASGKIRPAQMVTLGKLHHILTVLPRATESVTASVSVCSPNRKFGEIETFHWWEFKAEGEVLRITSGGYYSHPTTGGDTFSSMTWGVAPGLLAEFRDFSTSLNMVPDLRSFVDGVDSIDFKSAEYELVILDDDNPLLDEGGAAEEDNLDEVEEDREDEVADADPKTNEGTSVPWSVTSVDAAEKWLESYIDPELVASREPAYHHDVEECGICGCDLNRRGLHVDGRLRGDLMWSNMCVNCFKRVGAGIGCGNGQIYARQPNGDWRLVAGWRPGEA
jgi:hypothetical protein